MLLWQISWSFIVYHSIHPSRIQNRILMHCLELFINQSLLKYFFLCPKINHHLALKPVFYLLLWEILHYGLFAQPKERHLWPNSGNVTVKSKLLEKLFLTKVRALIKSLQNSPHSIHFGAVIPLMWTFRPIIGKLDINFSWNLDFSLPHDVNVMRYLTRSKNDIVVFIGEDLDWV